MQDINNWQILSMRVFVNGENYLLRLRLTLEPYFLLQRFAIFGCFAYMNLR